MNSVEKFYKRNGQKRFFTIPLLEGEYLAGRVILITGGSSGIGYSIAEACLRNGADVIIAGRNETKLNSARDELLKLNRGQVGILQLDITAPETFDSKVEESLTILNRRPDALVNSAGMKDGTDLGDTDIAAYDRVLETNLKGTYFFCQSFSNYMMKERIEGNILLISSASGVRPAISPYMLSKWGMVGLTEGLAKKLINYDIVVNGIGPGPAPTPLMKMDPNGDYTKPNSPAGRFIVPEEISNIAVLLLSNMGRMIVGETIFITGGVGTLTTDDRPYK